MKVPCIDVTVDAFSLLEGGMTSRLLLRTDRSRKPSRKEADHEFAMLSRHSLTVVPVALEETIIRLVLTLRLGSNAIPQERTLRQPGHQEGSSGLSVVSVLSHALASRVWTPWASGFSVIEARNP